MGTSNRASCFLCGLFVSKDAKACWATAGHGRNLASACRSECRFDLGDDGEQGGRGRFEVIAAVAHVGDERLNIAENGAFRATDFLTLRVSVMHAISACIERGKHPRS